MHFGTSKWNVLRYSYHLYHRSEVDFFWDYIFKEKSLKDNANSNYLVDFAIVKLPSIFTVWYEKHRNTVTGNDFSCDDDNLFD